VQTGFFFKAFVLYEEGHVTNPMDLSVHEIDLKEHHLIIPVRCALLPVGLSRQTACLSN